MIEIPRPPLQQLEPTPNRLRHLNVTPKYAQPESHLETSKTPQRSTACGLQQAATNIHTKSDTMAMQTMPPDYYATLGVSSSASTEQINSAFRKQAFTHHPDKGGKTASFVLLREAQEVLTDPGKRAQHDRLRGLNGSSNSHSPLVGVSDRADRIDEKLVELQESLKKRKARLEETLAEFAEFTSKRKGHGNARPTHGEHHGKSRWSKEEVSLFVAIIARLST